MKPFWQSKTFWAAFLTGAIGLYKGAFVPEGFPDVPGWVLIVLGGLGLYGRAIASKPLSFKLTRETEDKPNGGSYRPE